MKIFSIKEKDIYIYCADCLELIKTINNNTIDCTLCSPSYDNLRRYNGYSFDFEKTAQELFRITVEGGVVIWIVGDETENGSETGTSFRQALYFKEIGFNLHDTMIYGKNNPMPTAGKRYHQAFEYIFCFSKGEPKTFNPIVVKSKYNGLANMKNRGVDGKLNYKKIERTKEHKVNNIFMYSIGGGITTKDKIAFKHSAIMNEQLAQDQISTWTNEGDLVFDPFMGSCTSGKIALLNNRKFIGSEISENYFNICVKRLKLTLINNRVTLGI